MFTDDKVALSWSAPRALLPKNKVKLLLNLVVMATNAIPRGGAIAVDVAGDGEQRPSSRSPPRARTPASRAHVEALLAGTPESGTRRRPRHPALLCRPHRAGRRNAR